VLFSYSSNRPAAAGDGPSANGLRRPGQCSKRSGKRYLLGGDPVIVSTSPDAPLSSILDQMSIYDSLKVSRMAWATEIAVSLCRPSCSAGQRGVSDVVCFEMS
jgi:hypothetical protein